MTVKELIKELQLMPENAGVGIVYDGAIRADAGKVILARSRIVAIKAMNEPLYYDEDRPVGAPTSEEDPYWN
jgi:hypothetical protein